MASQLLATVTVRPASLLAGERENDQGHTLTSYTYRVHSGKRATFKVEPTFGGLPMVDLSIAGRAIRLKFILNLYNEFGTLEAWDYTDDSNRRELFSIRRYGDDLRLSSLNEETNIEIVTQVIEIAKKDF